MSITAQPTRPQQEVPGSRSNSPAALSRNVSDRLGQCLTLELKHAFLKRFCGVSFRHRARFLQKNRPVIVFVVHKMHRTAGYLYSKIDRCLMHSQPVHSLASKRWNQTRVNIDDFIFEVLWNQNMLEITTHDDKLYVSLANWVKHAR